MITTDSGTYSKFSLPIAAAIVTTKFDHFILEKLFSLHPNFTLDGGDTQLLKAELNQLFSSSATFSIDTLAFVDEWAVVLCPFLDLSAAKHYRNLLYQLYSQFENSDTLSQLSQKFQFSNDELLTTANSNLILDWMTLWLIHTYPNIALFALGKKHIRPFIVTKSFQLNCFICYSPALMLWKVRSFLHKSQTRQLMLELAGGLNVRHTPSCPFPFNRKMAHLFINSPFKLTFDAAIWRAIVLGWSGNEWLSKQLQTYFGRKNKEPDFIKLLVFFFRKMDKELPANEMKHLLGYLQHRWDEECDFDLKGWTLTSLQRKAKQWYENIMLRQQVQYLMAVNLSPNWKGASYNTFTLEEGGSLYEIIQLNSIKKLQEEGRRMMHCVGSYATRCQMSGQSIWSLRQTTGKIHRSLVTIEITKDHRIVQARKMFNANPESFERKLIGQWAIREGLCW